jgi:hypothetical protein
VTEVEQDAVWSTYLETARQLTTVRHGADLESPDREPAIRAAREELVRVRQRLESQRDRLRGLGVPEPELLPAEAEIVAAGAAMAAGPAAVRTALRGAGISIDVADAVSTHGRGGGWLAGWLPGLHPLPGPRTFAVITGGILAAFTAILFWLL